MFSSFSRQDLNCFKIFRSFRVCVQAIPHPSKEKHFLLRVVCRNGTGRSVSVFQISWVLVSDNLSTGMQDTKAPYHLYICIPISMFPLQASHLLSASPVSL